MGPVLRGQMGMPGSDPTVDPTGTAGVLKAQVMTGGGYDAHSGNASRSARDLQMSNTPGVYGMDFTRHWNSTSELNPEDDFLPAPFASGGWTHSWLWVATEGVDDYQAYDGGPITYIYYIKVNFPDGHTSQFNVYRDQNNTTSPYTVADWADGGTLADHLRRMASDGSQFYLFLSDGGSVFFQRMGSLGFRATTITDPHGLQTRFLYDSQGDLTDVLGPAGRSLHLDYAYLSGRPNKVISTVTANNGAGGTQQATYGYTLYSAEGKPPWYALTQVNYGVGQASAVYTYTGFVLHPPGFPTLVNAQGPVLTTADDPRYEGAMTRIRYVFWGGPGGNSICQYDNPQPPPGHGNIDYLHYAPFPIQKEISLDTGLSVSEFQIPCNGLTTTGQRTEIRGAGGRRMFYYGVSGGNEPGAYFTPGINGTGYWTPPQGQASNLGWQLAKMTDFSADPTTNTPSEYQHYHANGYPGRIFDGRNTLTEAIMTPGPFGLDGNGKVSEVHHLGAGTGQRLYNWLTPSSGSAAQDFNALPNNLHHWLYSQTDENGNITSYKRDSLQRVTEIDYPGGAFESFSYNNFNQVTSHTLASTTVVNYVYDARGMLQHEWNSNDGQANSTDYTYDSLDRIATISHAWSRAKGAAFSVSLTYNPRHQVLTETYPATDGGTNPYKQYKYDNYGNCTDIWDELADKNDPAKAQHYTYDSYRRCTSFTEPLNAANWNGQGNVASRTWNWYYDRYDALSNVLYDASTHTGKEWRVQVEPAFNAAGDRRLAARLFDYNDRMTQVQSGMIQSGADGSWQTTADTETVNYQYDANGNKSQFTDARGRITGYEYDLRNRQTKAKEEPNQTRITQTTYDNFGNKTQVTLPDLYTQRWQNYDAFGQPGVFIDERNDTTNLYYQWGPMKKLQWVITHRDKDGGGTEDQATNFYYDGLGKHTWTIFPDGSSELTDWGVLDQVQAYKTRANQTKRIVYDARGRETSHTWDGNTAPGINRAWDIANHLTSIGNTWSTVNYTYDQAGQVRSESDGINGANGWVTLNYQRYPSGEVAHLTYPNGWRMRKDYTARGQLSAVGWDDSSGNWGWQMLNYTYLPDGKVDHQDYYHARESFTYDTRGFISSIRHYDQYYNRTFTNRTYYRDNRDRIYAWAKGTDTTVNTKENGRGDRYGYDAEGQVTSASYQVTNPSGTASNPLRGSESLVYDALGNRKGTNVLANRGSVSVTRRDNGLNQYLNWGGGVANYDDQFSPESPGNANGVLVQDSYINSSFNALNQPVWVSRYPMQNVEAFGYDPLGRCVKRFTTGSLDPATNPATYFYYDGNDLIEEGSSSTAPTKFYFHGGRIDELAASCDANGSGSSYRFYHYDANGNCILLTDMGGNLLEQYEYDAFGKPYYFTSYGAQLSASNDGNRFLFTGREWLSELGLYDYRARLYQPELGRFLQPDPKEFEAGDYNIYRYCHNDPVNRSDPLGLLDYRFEKNFPEDGPGGRKAIQRAIENELRKTEKGREILDAKGTVVIHSVSAEHPQTSTRYSPDARVNDFNTYLNPKDSRFQDAKTFRALSKHPGELPPDSDKGRAVMIGHEFSHGVFKALDEHDGGRNIRDNENAIRRQLDLPLRHSDGGVPFRVDE